MNEIWSEISGYESHYRVSDCGRVKSVKFGKEIILKPSKDTAGYLRVRLYRDGIIERKRVHRLVCDVFIENVDSKPQVNHVDGNKQNNSVHNLEWVSVSENAVHAIKTKLRVPKKGKDHYQFNKPSPRRKAVKGINLQTLEEVLFDSIKSCAEYIKALPSGVQRACKGTNRTCKGWKLTLITPI